VWARPGFETLVSLPRLRFEPFGYQLQAAGTALRAMRGRAILADEVGLGKTIEAGLVASELRLRGLAARALILVPVGLVKQWRQAALPHPPPVLAAGLAGLTGRLADAWHPVLALATALGVDPTETAAAADELQRRLRLSPQQPW
jgi:SNF2 family DNA or RNA helicase